MEGSVQICFEKLLKWIAPSFSGMSVKVLGLSSCVEDLQGRILEFVLKVWHFA